MIKQSMIKQLLVVSCQLLERLGLSRGPVSTSNSQLPTINYSRNSSRGHAIRQAGFTLIETLVAILLICVAIIAPMQLTIQSLTSAYFARDQITASNLAQEGIEAIRAIRDGNILSTAEGTTVDLFNGILVPNNCGTACYIDALKTTPVIAQCPGGVCTPLLNNNGLYGYDTGAPTNFVRTIKACYVESDGSCSATVASDEARLTVTVSWQTAAFKKQSVTLTENLYSWPQPGSASPS